MTRSISLSLTAIALLITLGSCTGINQSSGILVDRQFDTVQVMLDPDRSMRWSPTRDSLVMECENCEEGYTRVIEHFQDDNMAAIQLSAYERLRMTLYGTNGIDTVITLEPLYTLDTASGKTPVKKRIVRSTPKRNTARNNDVKKAADIKKETAVKKVEKKEEVKKKANTVRVSAAEGVAIYKDKSKKEVIKIIPKGHSMPYIAREGDMISVTIDGQEGFVESEAVRIEE